MGGAGVFPTLERSGFRKPGVGRAIVALICVAVAAGCASSSSPSSTPSSPASPSSPAAPGGGTTTTPAAAPSTPVSPAATGPLACAPSDLKVTLGVSQGYAGGVYETIVFTNTSGDACSLYGYPGVSLVTAPPYKQIGLAAGRSPTTPVKPITLATGATANALLRVVDALNYPSASCQPTKATALRVYPPNQTAPAYLPSTSNGCANPVEIMNVGAVQAGSGNSS